MIDLKYILVYSNLFVEFGVNISLYSKVVRLVFVVCVLTGFWVFYKVVFSKNVACQRSEYNLRSLIVCLCKMLNSSRVNL